MGKTSPPEKKVSPRSRNIILRATLVTILLSSAAVAGFLGYQYLNNQESELFKSEYFSFTNDALDLVFKNMQRKTHAARTMSIVISRAFPNESSWPQNLLEDYEELAAEVMSMEGGRLMGFAPIVLPSQVASFEEFSFNYFDSNPDTIPPNAGYKESSGRGIWSGADFFNAPEQIVRDVSGNTTWGSPYKILTPLLQVNDMDDPYLSRYILRNTHASPEKGRAIDSAIECSAERKAAAVIDPNILGSIPCAILTDLGSVPAPNNAEVAESVLIQPIYPKKSPADIAGFIILIVRWAETVNDVVPNIASGVVAVVSTETTSYSYLIQNGVAGLMGVGDLHSIKYSEYKNERNLQLTGTLATERSVQYKLTFYPTDELYNQYHSSRPLYISLGSVGIILFALLTFLIYDYFMIRESNEKQVVLDTKRQFVRYISHEVRTPLNTVSMGIKLLLMEMQAYLCLLRTTDEANIYSSIKENEDDASTASQDMELVEKNMTLVIAQLEPWVAVVEEVGESVEDATVVLNDLLNYDKIEMGTLKLEVSAVDMWSLLSGVVRAFDLHAKKAGVSLFLLMDIDAVSCLNTSRPLRIDRSVHIRSTRASILCVQDQENNKIRGSMDMDQNLAQVENGTLDSCRALLWLRIMGDPTRLQQVVRNLVSNALKFTPAGGTVTVRARWVEDGLPFAPSMEGDDGKPVLCCHPRRGSLRVTVTDTGAGLDAEQLKQIFGEGVQFNPNVLQAGQGSGLGLFIAKGIAIKHQGALSVHSEGLGHGTTFTLELPTYAFPVEEVMPRSRSVEQLLSSQIRIESGHQGEEVDLQNQSKTDDHLNKFVGKDLRFGSPSARLLVVDDATSNRRMLIRILKNKGFECVEATNGQEALDEYRTAKVKLLETRSGAGSGSDGGGAGGDAEPFAAILMDFEMPVMNGPTATRHLREQEGCRAMIVGITGNVLSADVDHFMKQGASSVLRKPLNLDTFMSQFEQFHRDANAHHEIVVKVEGNRTAKLNKRKCDDESTFCLSGYERNGRGERNQHPCTFNQDAAEVCDKSSSGLLVDVSSAQHANPECLKRAAGLPSPHHWSLGAMLLLNGRDKSAVLPCASSIEELDLGAPAYRMGEEIVGGRYTYD